METEDYNQQVRRRSAVCKIYPGLASEPAEAEVFFSKGRPRPSGIHIVVSSSVYTQRKVVSENDWL